MKVLALLPEGFEEIEFCATHDVLRRADIIVEIASLTDNNKVLSSMGLSVYATTYINIVD